VKEIKNVGVIGLGKLGLPLALVLADAGFKVQGVDLSESLIDNIQIKNFRSPEPDVEKLLEKNFESISFSTSYEILKDTLIAYVIVPTPSGKNGAFENQFLESAVDNLTKIWAETEQHRTVVIVSTVMPGVTNEVILPIIEKNSKFPNTISAVYSPEFIALGSVIQNLTNPDMLLVGFQDDEALESHLVVTRRYLKKEVVPLELNFEEAEIVKLLVNTYVTMKISFANFIGEIEANYKTVSARKIAKSVGLDSRIGNKYLNPGLGYGGPCFPRDNKALQVFATSIGVEANLAAATDEINNRQPANMAKKIKEHYRDLETICIAGLSYKMYSNVTEASQGILLANELSRLGYIVTGFDQILSERPGKLDADIRFINDVKDLERYDLIVDSLNISSLVSLGDYSEELLLVN
jgi:UDPglucose 6-dehydrogenase